MRSHPGLRHNALVYDSQDEYIACAVPFLKEGIESGEGAVVAHTKPGLAMMREALGPHADHVTFVDVSSAYTRPARTLAAYHKVYARAAAEDTDAAGSRGRSVRPRPGRVGSLDWLPSGLQPLLRPLAGLGALLVQRERDADPIIEGVWETHPEVVVCDDWNRSDRYEDPDELLRRITPAPTPLPELRSIPFGRDVEKLREGLARELAAEGVPPAAGARHAARRDGGRDQRGDARRRRERSPRRKVQGTVRLRDRRPRRGLRRPDGPLPRPATRNRHRPLGRPTAEVATRVLPGTSRIHRPTLANPEGPWFEFRQRASGAPHCVEAVAVVEGEQAATLRPLAPRLSRGCAQIVTSAQPMNGKRCGTIVVPECNECELTGTLCGGRSPDLVVLGAVTVLRARLLPNAARCAADRCGKTSRGVHFRRPIVAAWAH
jgi:MEDS: MEthanogen/methylotroph, DcmR Sensory domain